MEARETKLQSLVWRNHELIIDYYLRTHHAADYSYNPTPALTTCKPPSPTHCLCPPGPLTPTTGGIDPKLGMAPPLGTLATAAALVYDVCLCSCGNFAASKGCAGSGGLAGSEAGVPHLAMPFDVCCARDA